MKLQTIKSNFLNLVTLKACRGGQKIAAPVLKPEGTIKDSPNFNVEEDCEALRDAIKGDLDLNGAAEKITELVTSRSNAQRQELKLMYAEMNDNDDLVDDLKGEFGGQYLDVLLALFVYPSVLDAWGLSAAVKGDGKSVEGENTLLEIIFTKCNEDVLGVTDAYETLYDEKLAALLDKHDDSCYLSKVFYSLCFANNEAKVMVARAENVEDEEGAKNDAETLLKENNWASLDSYFNKLLYQRSFEQLERIFKAYEKLAEKTIEDSIKGSNLDANLERCLLAIVKCLRTRYEYFADRLHQCMKGVGTKDVDLIQMLVSRSEVDLVQIKEAFEKKYGRPLAECVGEDITRGGGKVALNYKNAMVKIVEGNY